MFIPVLDPKDPLKLLFKYDPERRLIEIQRRGVKTLVDLDQVAEAWKEGRQDERGRIMPKC